MIMVENLVNKAVNFKNTVKYKNTRGKTVYSCTTQKEQLSKFWLIFLLVFHFLFNGNPIIFLILFNPSYMLIIIPPKDFLKIILMAL